MNLKNIVKKKYNISSIRNPGRKNYIKVYKIYITPKLVLYIKNYTFLIFKDNISIYFIYMEEEDDDNKIKKEKHSLGT